MRAWRSARTWLFSAESDTWLSILRIGLALQLIFYSLSLRADWNYLLAGTGNGLISRDLAEGMLSLESPFIPRLGWLVDVGNMFGAGEGTILSIAWVTLICAAILLLLGVGSRAVAIAAWLLHLSAVKSGGLLSYGVDNFTTIGLFYLMLSPLPDRYALDRRLRKTLPGDPELLGFWRRALQLHLCLAYFFGGLTKCLGSGWWDGSNLWRALIRPPFDVVAPEILVRWKSFLPFLGISAWVIEIGYAFFIWNGTTRRIWLPCVIVMHLVIGAAMGMYLFASIMIVLNIAAFGPRRSLAAKRPG